MLKGSYVFQGFLSMFISFYTLFLQLMYLLCMSGKYMYDNHVATSIDHVSSILACRQCGNDIHM